MGSATASQGGCVPETYQVQVNGTPVGDGHLTRPEALRSAWALLTEASAAQANVVIAVVVDTTEEVRAGWRSWRGGWQFTATPDWLD